MEKQIKKTNFVCDIETLCNAIVFCFVDYINDDRYHFVFWKNKCDTEELFKFLHRNIELQERHVTYNGLAFDSQIIQWMLTWEDNFTGRDATEICNAIYKYAQECIQRSNTKQWPDFAPWKLQIPQLDLYQMGHWFSDAKRASLKWLQCSIDWPNLEDMPYEHTHYVENEQQLNEIISYCYNDCFATKKVLHICKEAVDLRRDLTKEYGIDLYSASEPKMSKELFLHFLSIKLNIDKQIMKKWSTERTDIKVEDILLPYIKFERQEFIMLLDNFRKLVVRGDSLRGAFEYNVKYRGISIDYGMGGIHGMSTAGVYKSTETHSIESIDVKSFYPNECINNKWAPAHIPKEAFCDQYKWFYDERNKHPKGSAKNKALKLLLNSTFGLTIDRFSFLSDPLMGVQITCNGQLLLSMLLEMLCEGIPDAKPLVMNTDGIEIMIHKDQKSLLDKICKEWENITKLVLEYDKFDTILGFDCNNYISKYENGKLKGKGRFEYEPHDRYEIDVLHKNKSFLIIPKGVAAYFFDGIKPEDFVRQHKNIYDFCGFARARGKWKFIEITASGNGVVEKQIQKTMRYFMSVTGSKVVKRTKDDNGKIRTIQVVAGRNHLTVFNKYEEKLWENYDINYSWYVKEINKEIKTLEKEQLKLSL